MKIKYGDDIYYFNGDLNRVLFSFLLDEGIEEVELILYKDIFLSLLNNTLNFSNETDYVNLYQGLSYFGSSKERELIKYLYDKIYNEEKKKMQKQIEKIFDNRMDYVNIFRLEQNKALSEDFFEKHIDNFRKIEYLLCSTRTLNFLKKYNIEIDFYYIWYNRTLPLSFLEENIEKINWSILCENTSIPEEFFERHIDKVVWSSISHNKSISEQFFRKHIDKIHWLSFILNENQFNLQKEYLHKIPISARYTILNHCPFEYIDEYGKNNKLDMYEICQNTNVPLWYFEKYKEHIDWFVLSANPSIPFSFLQQNNVRLEWLYESPNVPLDFCETQMCYIDSLASNDFNLEQRVKEKIKNTKYFGFEPLNAQIKNIIN